MRRVTINIDEWVLQEAAAALDTGSVADTVHFALLQATEAVRGRRSSARANRWRDRTPAVGPRRRRFS